MESPSSLETPQPDASASLVPQECTNNKENAAPPSPVEREHDGLRKRPRDDERGARDAPQLLDAAQSDDASDALRARGAAPAKSPLPRILGKIMAQRAERGERAAARAKARGDDPGVKAYDTADGGARRYAGVGAAAYAARVHPSRAGEGTRYPIDWRKWGVYQSNTQIDEDIERFRNIKIGGKSALNVGVAVANAAGEAFFNNFEDMVPLDITCYAGYGGRAAALTTVATNKLANKAMGIDRDGYERTTEEGPHVEVLRGIREQLKKLGAVEGSSGRVEGPLAPFACRHTYHGHVGTGPANDTEVSPIGSLLRKFLIIGSYLGDLSDIVEDGVDCSFGKRTMHLHERGGLADKDAGNFGSAARGGAPLPPEHQGPRDLRFEFERYLGKGALGEGAYGLIGKTGGATLMAAEDRGKDKIFVFPMGGFNASTLKESDVVSSSKKPIRNATARATSWTATLERCKVVAPVLFYVYDALFKLGMMTAPTWNRSEYKCLKEAGDVIRHWREAKSPLADSFVAGLGDGAKLIISEDAFRKIQKWDKDAAYARTLLRYARVEKLSELVLVKGDSSDGVNVLDSRPFAGGHRFMPKHLAVDDGHGGFAPKRKKAKRGTGNGPTRYACHRCPHAWNPDPDAIYSDGTTKCPCGALVKPPTEN